MIPLHDAQRIVASLPLPELPAERVAVESAAGRVLASAPECDLELPPFDRVTMDGFAVRASDAAAGALLRTAGAVAAGSMAERPLAAGEAIRIMTGAPLPAGADAVVPIEEVRIEGERVRIERAAQRGQNVHPRGVDLERGARPLPAGTRITPARVPLLATLGCREVAVRRRPRVEVLSTGDELVEPGERPTGGQIRDSNRYALAAQVATAAAEPRLHPLVRDDRAILRKAVAAALEQGDVIVVTGGSSAGDFDFSKEVLLELGGKLWFEQVRIKPGKPVLLFTRGERIVFCLPGNPVSSFVTFELLVRPLLERLAGARECWPVPDVLATTRGLSAPAERDLLQLSRIRAGEDRHVVEPLRWSGSGDLVAIAGANALVHVRRGESLAAGAPARVLALRSSFDDAPRAAEPVA